MSDMFEASSFKDEVITVVEARQITWAAAAIALEDESVRASDARFEGAPSVYRENRNRRIIGDMLAGVFAQVDIVQANSSEDVPSMTMGALMGPVQAGIDNIRKREKAVLLIEPHVRDRLGALERLAGYIELGHFDVQKTS